MITEIENVSEHVKKQILNNISANDALNIFLLKATGEELKDAIIEIDESPCDWEFTFEALTAWLNHLKSLIGETSQDIRLSDNKKEFTKAATDVIKEINEVDNALRCFISE